VRLHEYAWGVEDASPLICVHGVGGHGLRFRRLAEERLARRFRVRALDLRGHGHSAWDPPWTIDVHVDDLRETVGSAAVWVGHSFGGRLVMELTARAPDLVARAVLLDPAMWVPSDVADRLAEEELRGASFASPEEAIAAHTQDPGLGFLAHTPREFLEEEARQHLVQSPDGRYRYRYSPETVAAGFHELTAFPPPFDALRVPTLLVVPSYSKLVSAGELEGLRAALGELLDVVVVPGGHIVLWDAHEATAGAIEAFLAPSRV
jgi:lipase